MAIDFPYYYGADDISLKNARSTRRNETKAEKFLWKRLRNRKLKKAKFRRQHPVGVYVVDFYCHEAQLAIEMDGGIHRRRDIRQRDENRQAELERLGLTVLRFTNDEVLKKPKEVLAKIKIHL